MKKMGIVIAVVTAAIAVPITTLGQTAAEASPPHATPTPLPLPPKLPEVKPATAQSTSSTVYPPPITTVSIPLPLRIALLEQQVNNLIGEVKTLKSEVAALQGKADQALYLPPTTQGATPCYQSGIISIDDILKDAPITVAESASYHPSFSKGQVVTTVFCPTLNSDPH